MNFIQNLAVLNLVKSVAPNPERLKIYNVALDDSIKIIKSKKKLKHTFRSEIKKDWEDNKQMYDKIEQIYGEDQTQILSQNFKLFNEYIIDKVPQELYNLIHQEIVQYIQPRFMDKPIIDGYRVPCCFTYKSGYEDPKKPKHIAKLNKDSIRLAELTPSNINKFAHVHPKLQKLFNHDNEFHDNARYYGGFIKYGVEQDTNSLIHTLSNLHHKKNISEDYIKYHIKPKLSDDNSLFTFMKMGEGSIVQLFKSESYDINDIMDFLDYIFLKKNNSHFEKIFIEKQIVLIKNYLKRFNKDLLEEIKEYRSKYKAKKISKYFKEKKYVYINKFEDLINQSDKSLNIKFLYDLIISKNNYIKYLDSNEIKDYKYIIPFVSELNPKHIYIIFENVDENINIKLPLNTYNITKDSIFNFIYKIDNIYEPIYYFNEEQLINDDKMVCDISFNLHSDKDINTYINNILSGIENKINEIYRIKYLDINLFELNHLLDKLEKPKNEIKLLVDNYFKISHVITKGNNIYPVVPCGVLNGFKLIYDFKNYIPELSTFLIYSKEKIIRNKFRISGFIVNEKNEIINIVFDNNSYIPVKPAKFNKKNKIMKRYPILGNKDLFLLDKDLQNFAKENDNRVSYNIDINYIKYITNLTIQNIIFYIKNSFISKDYFTDKPSQYTEKDDYTFKIVSKLINDKPIEFIENNNDLIDYFYEPNKFKGVVETISNSNMKDISKIKIKISLLNDIYLILNNEIHINFDKQKKLYEYIKSFINDIVIKLSDKDYDNHKLNNDLAICFENNDDCQYPCFSEAGKCKLYVKKSSIYDGNKSLMDKIIYKFVDLLLIHKDINKINEILQDNININDLYKTVKTKEIFLNWSQYVNKYLDELFKSESSYIRNINFYDQFNESYNSSTEPKPITSILKGVPNIIKQLFKSECNILTYIEENNLDFISLEKAFKEIFNKDIDSIKIKTDICTILNEFYKKSPKNMRFIVKSYDYYDKEFVTTDLKLIKENILKLSYKISPFDLEILSQKYNIGFLLISSKFTTQDPTKLKHNIILKYNNDTLNKNTNFVLLYHYLNENDVYDLSNIVIKVNELDDDTSYKTFLPLKDLYEIKKIKTIIDNDYPDIKLS